MNRQDQAGARVGAATAQADEAFWAALAAAFPEALWRPEPHRDRRLGTGPRRAVTAWLPNNPPAGGGA